MPPRIAALPRSAGGLPVPYVAQWDGEEEMGVRPCQYALGRASVFPLHGSQIRKTRPVFGIMEPSRQREVAMAVRCQVCRHQLGPMSNELTVDREVHWLVDLLHQPATMKGHWLALEPWVCDECLPYALAVCPGMLAAKESPIVKETIKVPRSDRLRNVLAVWTANIVATTIQPHGNLDGRKPCVSYLKIEPLKYVRMRAYTFMEYGPAAIKEMLEDEVALPI